ncbi:MAG: hypothetical protein AAFV53_30555 [Myxococcota bacterium]
MPMFTVKSNGPALDLDAVRQYLSDMTHTEPDPVHEGYFLACESAEQLETTLRRRRRRPDKRIHSAAAVIVVHPDYIGFNAERPGPLYDNVHRFVLWLMERFDVVLVDEMGKPFKLPTPQPDGASSGAQTYLTTPLRWFLASKPAVPYRTVYGTQMLVVRRNRLTRFPNPSKYTLLGDAQPIVDFDEWPAAWGPLLDDAPPVDWPRTLQSPGTDLILVHDDGQENAPDDPIGRNRLVLHGDGRARLENRKSGQQRGWEATLRPDTLASLTKILRQMSFPNIPMRPLVPGASARWVRLMSAARFAGAVLSRDYSERHEPDRSFCVLVDTLIAQISGFTFYAHLNDAAPLLERR